MNTRINAIPQIESALRLLESFAYDTSSLWSEHQKWLEAFDVRQPTDHDHKWATRAAAPSPIVEHLAGGFETLSSANAFPDRQFVLSPGQRDTLREKCGLTPTQVIVLRNATTFRGTNVLHQLTIASAEHIDPRRRKHVLVSAVVEAASFFEASAARDKEREAEREALADADDKKRIANGEKPRSVKAMTAYYLD